ncbi:Tyrosinase [Purpureocillium lavendulum]|uniref:Tyrosinase n=1 Tax=Purpureocillium lavendulum TaxID=1247861 RepID=A0AB34FZW6_9HYPO|nr:Tyrosinase [Purpureocillium lavendulum]
MTTPPPSPPREQEMPESNMSARSHSTGRSPSPGTSPVRSDKASKARRSHIRAPSLPDEDKKQPPHDYRHRRPSMVTCDALLRPRPYEEISAEIAYLNASLEIHSSNTRELIRRYAQAEDELRPLEHVWCKQRRRLRKQLNLLRVQINGAAAQEQAVFLRLSELYMEAQSRETRTRRSHQPGVGTDRSWGGSSTDGRTGHNTSSSSLDTKSRPMTPLNAEALEFVPEEKGFGRMQGDGSMADDEPDRTGTSTATTGKTNGPLMGSGRSDVQVHIAGESCESFDCNHGLKYEFAVAPDDDGRLWPVPRRMPSLSDDSDKLLERRPSLPNLSSQWPG